MFRHSTWPRLFEESQSEVSSFQMDDKEVKQLIVETATQTASETRKHFEAVAEGLEKKIDAVAEAVAVFDEKLDRRTDETREEMRRGFSETQAMIKFSHAELDRRVRGLEQAFADLQARVERLEETPH